ncbi:Mechanosensitive ion channel-domain-containing protein [Podospora aff. communis PSN243]|uniref:Mechanosensitive ion channel protein n=1 Tax=Podospora aff. communis PSN243 TaxID=3040156 RepID=A0AAV9GWM7_9PEZI|nr:Mechanosensitive ion channel-domain-containing protein [Podospora aff. communis PSN243]
MSPNQLRRPELQVQVPSYDSHNMAEQATKQDPNFLAAAATIGPSESREAANRLNDDLELLRAERVVSHQEHSSRHSRMRSHQDRNEDVFHSDSPEKTAISTPKKKTWLTTLWASLKKFPRVLRYILYALPAAVVLLIPIFLDLFAYDQDANPVGGDGGVELLWFGIWLEIVWISLWATRIIASVMPFSFGFVASSTGSSNDKKWRDIGRQLELPTALFLWLLAVLVSYHPVLKNHMAPPADNDTTPNIPWIGIVFKIIIAIFTMATLNLVEKVLIQWIATSFHLRTYSHRIRQNQMLIDFMVILFEYAKTQIEAQDPVWDSSGTGGYNTAHHTSGARTPMMAIRENARQAWSKVGGAATRMAGDFTGRRILKGDHPRKVVVELLRNTQSSYTLARVFYRTFVKPDMSTISLEDLMPAFATSEQAEACFSHFDKDLNGDISMEELEMVCNEIHLEKKAIAASLKDLDSVIKKLDEVFMVVIVIIVIIVFISIISNSAAAALTSAGTVILGLSWLLQATAQEFLQSIIFVFVKHPFDVGDRVTVYGNTGSAMMGDDYYVLEVSLLYTEFKKMQGHVVQAPNSLLNTLFILNQRRSEGLADPITLKMKFGTTEAQIEELKARMSEFCLQNKRDYETRILSEVVSIDEVYSITMNIIFFHKSNYQNELLRLSRHNRFAVELMHQMKDMGIEGPRVVQPGGMREMPVYWSSVQPPPSYSSPEGMSHLPAQAEPQEAPAPKNSPPVMRRRRNNSRAAVVEAGMDFQDIYRTRRMDGAMMRLASVSPGERSDSHGLDERLERLDRISSRGSGSISRRGWVGRGGHPKEESGDVV